MVHPKKFSHGFIGLKTRRNFYFNNFLISLSFTICKYLHRRISSDKRVNFSLRVKDNHEQDTGKFLDKSNEHLCKISSILACTSHWDSFVNVRLQ